MEFEGKLTKRQGDKGHIEIADVDWQDVNRKATGRIVVHIEEKDDITDLQRKLLFALWRDYESYTGTPIDAVEAWFKYEYMLRVELDHLPSVSRGGMSKSQATDFVTFTMEYFLNHGIPFQQRDYYKGADIGRTCYAMLMNRICFVCGKEHSDVHHINGSTVGMGNDRRKVEHAGRFVVCLCRQHHGYIHQGGEKEFFHNNHIVPVKLTAEMVKELRIGG